MTNSNATLLLVDDDPAIMLTIGDKLQSLGYKVIKATSAEEANVQLTRAQPDLIILDISMPGMGGMGFLKTISNPDGTLRHPVLVFTARSVLSDFFHDLGVAGFLAKTAAPERLIEEIQRITERRKSTPAPAPASPAPRAILLVEDDGAVKETLLRFFQRKNFEAWSVDRGSQLFKAVLDRRPDIIFVKYYLPDMNGPALAQRLAGEEFTRGIPVVLYDESGIHPARASFPHVHAYSPSADGEELLNAMRKAITSASAGIPAVNP